MSRAMRHATVYAVSRQYGGPEEGGWWYDWIERRVHSEPAAATQEGRAAQATALLDAHGWQSAHPRFSVLGGEDAVVFFEEEPGALLRAQTVPRYE